MSVTERERQPRIQVQKKLKYYVTLSNCVNTLTVINCSKALQVQAPYRHLSNNPPSSPLVRC